MSVHSSSSPYNRVRSLVAMIVIVVLACCEGPRRSFPTNLILLGVFTLAIGVMLGVVSAYASTEAVLIALGITCVIVFALTIFAMFSKVRRLFRSCFLVPLYSGGILSAPHPQCVYDAGHVICLPLLCIFSSLLSSTCSGTSRGLWASCSACCSAFCSSAFSSSSSAPACAYNYAFLTFFPRILTQFTTQFAILYNNLLFSFFLSQLLIIIIGTAGALIFSIVCNF